MEKTFKEKPARNKKPGQLLLDASPLHGITARLRRSKNTMRKTYVKGRGKAPDKNMQRNKIIYKEIVSGESYQQVGSKLGLTKERIRQIYLKLGGTQAPFKEKKRKKLFKKGLDIAEKFMEGKKYFPPHKEFLQFLIQKRSSTYTSEIYKKLSKKYKGLPTYEAIAKQEKKEKLLSDLKQLYSKVKMPLSMSYHLNRYGLASNKIYMYYFGTFRTACHLAGVPCGKRGGNVKERGRVIRKSVF